MKTLAGVLALVAGMLMLSPRDSGAQSGIFRLVTFSTGSDLRLGATEGDGGADIVDVHNAAKYLLRQQPPALTEVPFIPADMRSLVEVGGRAVSGLRAVYQAITNLKSGGKFSEPGGADRVFHPPISVRLRPPIPNPSKILGLAGNYPRRGELANPQYPSAFFKSVAALTGQDDIIDLAGLVTTGVHEPEFAVVIGKKAKNVPKEKWLDYVFGYTIMNDVSSRDLPQGKHPSQGSTLSKGLDTFAPCGPYLTLKEDVPDPHNLAIEARINGKPWDMPNRNTSYLTFKTPELIAYFSERMTLLPGDIISTGVPAPVVTLKAGDTIEITIERLGTLRNKVVAKATPTTDN